MLKVVPKLALIYFLSSAQIVLIPGFEALFILVCYEQRQFGIAEIPRHAERG